MATRQSQKRLTKEYKALTSNPPPYISAKPNDENIFEWHFVITGPPQTPFEEGQYHGMLRFPHEYPFKPPSISMITPNGRFACNTRLCLSMSDYHPDTWNPAWSVATILTGLLSFMTGDESTTGSITTSETIKKKLAKESKKWNMNENQRFIRQFPNLVAQNKLDIEEEKRKAQIQQQQQQQGAVNNDGEGGENCINLKDQLDLLDPEDRARLLVEQDDSVRSFWLQKYTIIGILLAGLIAASFNIVRRA
ncbi:ubiquitin-conjugating enzyme E2 6 [[Candida] railenensis]|uniref:Ubiquitin-conjugating enzyme E2 6 n=1 Tax=[Candida] railenensis TaxID=45579 RepID=A0A9P0QSN3_9ASCO|nr:ubiquitin-conjugating enzyme E2 6 [[Candida] railenensis]